MENEKNTKYDNLNAEELKSKALDDIIRYFESEENIENSRMGPSMIVNAYWDMSQNSENVKKRIIDEHEKYTSVYADVVSSLENPNCSCRGRFASFIMENKDSALESYNKIINSLSNEESKKLKEVIEKQEAMFGHFQIDLKNKKQGKEKDENVKNTANQNIFKANLDEEYKYSNNFPAYLEGNVIEIEDTAESYGNLIKDLRRGGEFYKGLNLISKPGNKLWVYFY